LFIFFPSHNSLQYVILKSEKVPTSRGGGVVLRCDAVFEGGGVKGIAFVGAIQETERRGYCFHQLAGTSSGAIVTSLLAAGYSGKEIEEIMEELSFPYFLDSNWVGKIPVLGKGLNILFKNGMYSGALMEEWIGEKLRKKGIVTFGDLPEGKLKIIASDITNGRILVIPDDLHRYNIKWETFSVGRAVRMSSTIPYFFQPSVIKNGNKKNLIVDGAMLSSFPVWLFDSSSIPRWPTFGYRLRGSNMATPSKITGPISMLMAIFSTMMEAHDRRYVAEKNAARTIFVPVDNIKATDFSITAEQKRHLIELGRAEARQFFDRWDFASYIKQNRKKTPSVNIKS
jgi:NTE family protein